MLVLRNGGWWMRVELFEQRSWRMFILIPLGLIGIGVIAYCLFTWASYALPLAMGIAAGFAVAAMGFPPFPAIAIGALVFMVVIALGRFAAMAHPKSMSRAPLVAIFAIPAAIAGYSVASAFTALAGFTSIGVGIIAAIGCGVIATRRLVRPI